MEKEKIFEIGAGKASGEGQLYNKRNFGGGRAEGKGFETGRIEFPRATYNPERGFGAGVANGSGFSSILKNGSGCGGASGSGFESGLGHGRGAGRGQGWENKGNG